jgi:hypothetical protein
MLKALRLAIVFLGLAAGAHAQTPWSFYWITPPIDCNHWGAPIVSDYYPHCDLPGLGLVSMCPTNMGSPNSGPWQAGKPINITGGRLMQVLTDPTATGYAVVGHAQVAMGQPLDGMDVFLATGGTGTNSSRDILQPGQKIAAGRNPLSHLDGYAQCDKGQQIIYVLVGYEEATP